MSFPTYDDMKDSGIPWIGCIPTGWQVTQGRRLFAQLREPAHPGDEQLSATQKYGVLPQSRFMELEDQKVTLALRGLENFKHVQIDDFVISLRSFQGGIEHSLYVGCVSPAYTILRPLGNVHPQFWKYLLKSAGYIEALQSVTDGIRDGKNISYEQFGMVYVPDVPLPEQRIIAAFLDAETSKIDALVSEQRRLIELLKEKRQAVISHAVTKGLNPNAPMKPSGIQWLGDVPEHWKTGKCGFYVSILSGYAFSSSGFSDDENNIRLLRGINVGVSEIKWDETVYWKRTDDDGLDRFELKAGELVIGMDRPWISSGVRVAKISDADVPCMLLQRVAAISTDNRLHTDFLWHLLSSEMFVGYSEPETTGVSVPHISPKQIEDFLIPVPPIEEQNQIVKHVSSEITRMGTLIAQAERAIELLQERRTALISAAVTGKIDVRGFASKESVA